MMLTEKFQKYIAEHSLIEKNSRILVAVSGGVDSMVLLSLFIDSGYDVAVAHCNFQLRGKESDEDETLVAEEADKYGIPLYNKRFNTEREMEITGESVQLAARRLRYDWFAELSEEHGYDVVAIAHHADDSIETFFINMLRGTGLRGLTGIDKVNGNIIRPLLFASRKEILDYAHAKKIHYREDSTNRSTKYLRNKLRLGIIPLLRDINPKFTEMMTSNISRLTEAQLFIDRDMETIRNEAVTKERGFYVIDPAKIDPGLPLNYVIYELMSSEFGFKGNVTDEVMGSLHRRATGKKFYSKDFTAYINRGKIIVSPTDENDPCDTELTEEHHKISCGNSVLIIEHTDIDNIDTLKQPDNVALLDMDKLSFPLRLRRWQEGDSFIPFGMNNRKKVSDYLIDEKISMAEKGRQFVLMNGEDIVWLVGKRIDDRYKINDNTENVLKIIQEII